MKQRLVETKAEPDNIREKDDTEPFLETGHYHLAGDGGSGDTIRDGLRDPIYPFLGIRGAMFAWMRRDMKQRVVETEADTDNIKEEDEETPNTHCLDKAKS